MFDSVTSITVQGALDGLALRQRSIANNIANVNTPNYQAQRVSFEDALAKAAKSGTKTITEATIARSVEPTKLNGNNVNLDTETVSSVDTVLRFQFATQSVGGEASSLRTAMRTS